MALKEQIQSVDEINMATTRLRLRFVDEPLTDPPQQNVIDESSVRNF